VAVLSSPRNRVIAGAVVVTVVVLVAVAAFVGLRGHPRPVADSQPMWVPGDSAPPSDSPSPQRTESPSPTPSPTPSRKPTPAQTKKKAPPPQAKPVQAVLPPPPHGGGKPPGPSSPPPGATCPKLTGPAAPRSEVAATISAAAARSYQPVLSNSDANPPAISVRLPLIQGVAWEESGWQSTILACDGGTGTMQLMQPTADWMNGNYGTSYDFRTLPGNVSLGTGYLAWMTRYFGDRYFNGNYSLAGDPVKIVLLDMVISGYQAGPFAVDKAMAAGTDLPNRWYVDTVEGFMTNQPWQGS